MPMPFSKSMKRFVNAALAVAVLATVLLSSCKNGSAPANGDVLSAEDAALVQEVQEAHSAFLDSLQLLDGQYDRQMALYIRYNRACRVFLARHPESMAQIDVLSLTMADGVTPVFAQPIDALLYQSVYDRLAEKYPRSARVKELGAVTEARLGQLELSRKVQEAREVGYIDIALKDAQSQEVRLSEIDAPVKMVYFWTVEDPRQLIFNKNVLEPAYEKFHDRGFEIYSVSLDTDRSVWAQSVYEQKLPWVQVNDSRGAYAPVASLYNIQSLPWAAFICHDEIVPAEVSDLASLESFLSKQLK